MQGSPVTVEEVREAQEYLKTGMTQSEEKNFHDARESFRNSASVHPFDEKHIEELEKKLQAGGFKKQQECLAYMGCAAVHLKQLVAELSDEQQAEVPVDEQLLNVFKDWD
jgi:hypothetical protein